MGSKKSINKMKIIMSRAREQRVKPNLKKKDILNLRDFIFLLILIEVYLV